MKDRNLTDEQKKFIEDEENIDFFYNDYITYMGMEPSKDDLINYMLEAFEEDYGSNCEEEHKEEIVNNTNAITPVNPFLAFINKLFGILFVLWFIASLVLCVVVSETNEILSIIIVGQVFLGVGLALLIMKIDIGKLLSAIGGIVVVGCLIYKYPDLLPFNIDWELIKMLIGGIVSFGLSFYINVVSVIEFKKRCSTQVNATVINMVEGIYPVYEYEYNGKKYKVRVGRNKKLYKGQLIQIKINPNKPREVYYKPGFSLASLVTLPFLFIGACLILGSVWEIINKFI